MRELPVSRCPSECGVSEITYRDRASLQHSTSPNGMWKHMGCRCSMF
jgi:hypothetical protein